MLVVDGDFYDSKARTKASVMAVKARAKASVMATVRQGQRLW